MSVDSLHDIYKYVDKFQCHWFADLRCQVILKVHCPFGVARRFTQVCLKCLNYKCVEMFLILTSAGSPRNVDLLKGTEGHCKHSKLIVLPHHFIGWTWLKDPKNTNVFGDHEQFFPKNAVAQHLKNCSKNCCRFPTPFNRFLEIWRLYHTSQN